jgi:transcriptional regulator with XRE-family HTH domain
MARKAQKRSLVDLERSCRVHRQTLARLERGDPGVSLGVFLSVLEALRELSSVELLVYQPHTPAHLRAGVRHGGGDPVRAQAPGGAAALLRRWCHRD